MKIKKLIIIPEETVTKADILQNQFQIGNFTEVVKQAISYMYKNEIKEQKAYEVAKLMSAERLARTPEEKAIEKIEIEEAKIKAKEMKDAQELQKKIENGRKLCKHLGGKIKPDSKGVDRCEYHRGSYINPQNANITHEIEYMDDLKQHDVDFQFFNSITGAKVSKEEVISALATSDEVWPE